MKHTKIIASVLAAALCTVPLAACGGNAHAVKIDGEQFVLSDYATDVDEVSLEEVAGARAEYSATEVQFALSALYSSSSYSTNLAKKKVTNADTSETKYSLYNLKTNADASNTSYDSIGNVSGSPFLTLNTNGDTTTTVYASPKGETLATSTSENPLVTSTGSGSYGEDYSNRKTYCSLTVTGTTGNSTTYYYSYDEDAEDWVKLTEEEVKGGDYAPGATLGVRKYAVSEMYGGEEIEDYKYAGYEFSVEGTESVQKITVYNNNSKTGSFTVYGELLGVIGKYAYYYNTEAVDADATSGYNYEDATGTTPVKANKTLMRYDFTADKETEVDSDYYFETKGVLYNKTEKDMDKMIVTAYKKSGGVAIISEQATEYTLVIDENAKVSYDLSDKSVGTKFYQLSDTRYLSGSTILDENLDTVANLPSGSVTVWKSQGLIYASVNGSSAILVDYNGTVTIALDSMSGFVGDNVIGMKDGKQVIANKNNPTGQEVSKMLNPGEGDSVTLVGNACLKKYVAANVETPYTYYTLGGTVLQAATATNYSYGFTAGGKVVLTSTGSTSLILG